MAATTGESQLPPYTDSSKTSFDLEPNPFEQSFATKDHPNNNRVPNISASSPQILTPGGRKLPPLVLSPNVQSSWNSTNFGRTGLTPNESGLRTGLTPGGPGIHSLNGISLPGLNTPGSLGFSAFTPGLSSLLGGNGTTDQNSNHLAIPNQQQQTTQPQPQAPQTQQPSTQPPVAAAQQQQQLNQNFASQPNSAAQSLHQSPVQNFQTIPQPASVPQASVPAPAAPQTHPTIPQAGSESTISKTSADTSPKAPEPPKRGRKKGSTNKVTKPKVEEPKRKKAKVDATKPTSTTPEVKDEVDEDNAATENMTESEKRKHFLERNRVAASKCRQRKKQLMVKMETDLNFYLNEYNNLTATVDQLKDQSIALKTYLLNNKGGANNDIIHSVDNLLTIINNTNYMSRLRGNAPSDIIPTVQAINPALVNQENQPPSLNAFSIPQQQQQQPPQQQQELLQNSLPNTVPNSVPGSNNNSSTNLQHMNHQLQQQMLNNTSSSAPPAMRTGQPTGLVLNNDWTRAA